jgi:RHS repeat-associated protein
VPDGASCDNGDPCKKGATCLAGACNASANDGTSCSDGDACNGVETCKAGACTPGTPVAAVSPPGDACRSDLCDPTTGVVAPVVCSPINTTAPSDLAQTSDFIIAQQPGAVIDPKRICVLRGHVFDTAGMALPNVNVSIVGDTLSSVARTRLDGHFDYAVNGGAEVGVRFTKPGYKPVQRSIACSWKEYAQVPDVVMTRVDPAVTPVTLGASSFQVARGSFVQDADGMRRATILVPPSAEASFVFPDGTMKPVTGELSVRATEFTVGPNGPKAMPLSLPPTSGYTYAVDLSADEVNAAGATKAVFSGPQCPIVYVENFIGFPVSATIPSGEVDGSQCAWVPVQNGKVVEIQSVSGGVATLATALDATGHPLHSDADEAALGITNGERAELGSLYAPGQTLWRVPVCELVDPDFNCSGVPPSDFCRPDDTNCQGSPPVPAPVPHDSCRAGAIGCQSQTLCENIGVVGTPYQLTYASDRVAGRKDKYSLTIPLVGATVPASVKRVELQIQVAGQVIEQKFACPCTGLPPYVFQWDGKDAFGRLMQGSQPVEVVVSYVYPTRYGDASTANAFGAYSSPSGPIQTFGFTGARSTSEMLIFRVWHGELGTWNEQGAGLGGWDLDIHHTYDPVARMLYRGDCTRRQLPAATSTVAGGPSFGAPLTGPCGSASSVYVGTPRGVVARSDGSAVFTDTVNGAGMVRAVNTCGAVSTLATIPGAWAIARGCDGCDGSVYVSSLTTCNVYRVDPNNTVTVVAGTGTCFINASSPPGDGGPATAAQLGGPVALSVGPDGSLYIADRLWIRRVAVDGIITTVAGNGTPGSGPIDDGKPATQAGIIPEGVVAAQNGSVYISTGAASGAFIRVLKQDGTIGTVVGTFSQCPNSYFGFPLDGSPALASCLTGPGPLTMSKDGLITFTDEERIRQVGADGIVRTIAGAPSGAIPSCSNSYCGDGVPAGNANLAQRPGIAFAPDGSLLVAAPNSNVDRIVRVDSPQPRFGAGTFVLPSADASEVYTFDTTGRHLQTQEALTGAVKYSFAYDTLGRVSTVTYAPGTSHVTTVAYGSASATITSPYGDVTTLALDASGNLTSVSHPGGPPSAPHVESYTLASTPDGLLTSLAFPDDHAYTMTYDATTGRLTSDADPAGGNQSLAYTLASTVTRSTLGDTGAYPQSYQTTNDTKGDEIRTNTFPTASTSATTTIGPDGSQTITLPDGTLIKTTLSPDPRFGLLAATTNTTTTLPVGGVSRVETVARSFDAQKRLNEIDLVNGNTWTKVFDPVARTITWTSPVGRTRVTQLDAQGRVVKESAAGLGSTSYAYDTAFSHLGTTTRSAPGEAARVSQNIWYAPGAGLGSAGNLASVTDPMSNTTTYDLYDVAGRVLHEVLPGMRPIGFAYDAIGNRIEVDPPAATPSFGSSQVLQTQQLFGYTMVGELASYQVKDASNPASALETTAYTYTPDRMLKTLVRPEGDQVTYTNSLGRVDAIALPTGESVHYAYDSVTGRLASVTGPSSVAVTFGYNGPLVTDVTWTGISSGLGLHRTYTNDLRVASETAQGLSLYFGYDADGLLQCLGVAQASNCAGQVAITRVAGTTVLAGVVSPVGAATQVVEAYTANGFGETLSHQATFGAQNLYTASLTRDALGRIATKNESLLNADATVSSGSFAYSYDAAGRLTDVVAGDGTHTHDEFDLNGNLLRRTVTGPGGTSQDLGTYGIGDRLLSYKGATYAYTASGRLQSATSAAGVTTYSYDALGNLRDVVLANNSVLDYLVDGQNRRIGKKVGGQLTQAWLWADAGHIAAEVDFDSLGNVTTIKHFGYGSRTNVPDLMVLQDGTRYRILSDGTGSPRSVVLESTGAVAARMDYDELGRVVVNTKPGFVPFGFAGGLYDPDTGLVRFGSRDYDATTGRWTSKETPQAAGGTANSYVLADPVNLRDAMPAPSVAAPPFDACSNGGQGVSSNAGNGATGSAGGTCPPVTCNPGFGDCDGNACNGCETDLTTTLADCGACGHTCGAIANGTPACVGGACVVGTCNPGFADCDKDPSNGCEASLSSVTSCGACGHACLVANATPVCVGGACAIAACNAGFADCDMNPANGCERSLATSVGNCGACGHACAAVANGLPACVGGACAIGACAPGFANCDGVVSNGCEANLGSATSCGTCGNACATANGTPDCVNGACAIGGCNPGFTNCSGNPTTGCETNVLTSVTSCGVCGHACTTANGTPACVGGACTIGACNPGFANCSNNPATGCETSVTTVANCGACGNACAVANGTAACVSGSCAIGSCNAGFANCDGIAAHGCNVDITTATNCGACGVVCKGAANASPACAGGACTLACSGGFGDCDNNAANGCETALNANPNCGGCGFSCSGGCNGGTCVATVTLVGIADNAVITKPTQVSGTVSDGTWKLEYRLGGRDDVATPFTTLASGAAPVNGVLGTFDPTLLLNGIYTVKLTATTPSGDTSTSVAVAVDGRMKVGFFTLSFVDLDVPVGGVPFQILRTYDSRDKRVGDFGVGWNVNMRNVRIEKAGKTGKLWQQIYIPDDFFPQFCLEPAAAATVTITFPGGRQYRFEPQSFPHCQILHPVDTPDIHWTSTSDPDNPTVTLTSDSDTSNFVDGPAPGEVRLLDSSFDVWDPRHFTLTIEDGSVYSLDQDLGVTKIAYRNGQTLTVSSAGVLHSSGKSIPFTRDSSARITTISDPSGNAMSYAYSAAGDLASFTDRVQNTTTYTYAANHYFQDMFDPLNRRPIRCEYDADNRLVKRVDAAGSATVFTHDLGSQSEQVVDRLGNLTQYSYNVLGDITGKIDALGHLWTYTYNTRGDRLSSTDPLGNTTTWTYDGADNPLTGTDPLGNVTTNTYNAYRQLLTSTDALGHQKTNVYDASGNLLNSTDPVGAVTKYTYDATGHVLKATDALGSVTTDTYDAAGNVATETDALGHVTTYVYDANNRMLSETTNGTVNGSPQVLVTAYAYDKLGRPVSTTFPDGTVQSMGYTPTGKVATQSDELGHVTTYAYDTTDRLISTTRPDSTVETSTYDAEGRQLSRVDAAGNTTTFQHDTLGRVVSSTFADGSSSTTTYDASGRVSAATNELGNATAYTYDAADRQTSATDPLGGLTQYAYDAVGNQTGVTDPLGHLTSFDFDAAKRQTAEHRADGTSLTTTYDALGRMVAKTDALGRVTAFSYDALGRLLTVTDPLSQKTQYTYDQLGNRVTQTDANGHTTTFRYDARARETARILPDGVSNAKVYDAAGGLLSRTDFAGQTTSYTRDVMERVVKRTYPDASSVTFAYTPTGQRSSVTDAHGVTTYTYDARNRLTSLSYPDGRALGMTYDLAGRRTSVTADVGSASLATTTTYDAAGRASEVIDPLDAHFKLSYDLGGNRSQLVYPNGVATTYAYDAQNRVVNVAAKAGAQTVASFAYTLDAGGRRTQIAEADGTVRQYGYDGIDRLVSEAVTGPLAYQKTFAYDAVGNRLSQVTTGAGAASINYAYDTRDRISTENAITYAHDPDGNVVSKSGEATYTWDFENRLVSAAMAAGPTVNHEYDADGNRLQTTTTVGAVETTTNLLVDPIGCPSCGAGRLSQVVAETDGNGVLTALYVRAGNELLEVIRPDGMGGWKTRFVHHDGLGSVRALTDGAGAVTDTRAYEAFGTTNATTGGDPISYGFAGEPFDATSALAYHRARWMDPRVGRFTAMDSWDGDSMHPATLHRYVYAVQNPLGNVDPSGHDLRDALVGQEVHSQLQQHFRNSVSPECTYEREVTINTLVLNFSPLRPDLVDTCEKEVYEIKPWKDFAKGVRKLQLYEALLNGGDFVSGLLNDRQYGSVPWHPGVLYVPPSSVRVDIFANAYIYPPELGVIIYTVVDLSRPLSAALFFSLLSLTLSVEAGIAADNAALGAAF